MSPTDADRAAAPEAGTDGWYLARLRPGGLEMAVAHLARQGFPSFCPRRAETRRHRGRFVETLQPLFPGYLFLRCAPDPAAWRAIDATRGIAALVRFGNGPPAAVPAPVMAGLMARCDTGGLLRPPPPPAPGARVRILSGGLAEMLATVEQVAPDRRIWLLLDLMGRDVRVTLPGAEVEPAGDPGRDRPPAGRSPVA